MNIQSGIDILKQANDIKYDPSNVGGRTFVSFVTLMIFLFFIFCYGSYHKLWAASDLILLAGIAGTAFSVLAGKNVYEHYTKTKANGGQTNGGQSQPQPVS